MIDLNVDCAGDLPEAIIKYKDVKLKFVKLYKNDITYKGFLDKETIIVDFELETGDQFDLYETISGNSFSAFRIIIK